MKPKPGRIALAVVAVGMAASALIAQPPSPPPRRVALLVGINQYNRRGFVDLKWAENDVEAVGRELARIGFDKVVTLKGSAEGDLKATRPNIEKQLMALLSGVGKRDLVLVMLSGHGQELKVGRPDGSKVTDQFYCPADAVLNRPETMVSLTRLTDETLAAWGGRNLVLVDACRDGAVDQDRGTARGIQGRVVALPEGTAVLFACASGQRSIELDRLEHGVFTHGVIESLKSFDGTAGPLTWGSLVDRVQNAVAEMNPDQEPIAAGVLGRLVLADRIRGSFPTKKLVKPSSPPTEVDTSPTRPTPNLALEGSRAGDLRDDNGLKMKFRWCPPGSFRMGSPRDEPGRFKQEGPVDVTLSRGFWLGQHEVTQSEWQAVMGTTLREQRDKVNRTTQSYNPSRRLSGEGASHPMYYVSHDEATEFCHRWTEAERRAGRLTAGWTYALPTEAQWEYACRAGTTTATAFGDRLSSREANLNGNLPYNGAEKGPYLESTVSVGSYRPNAWGLCDMDGNVEEWCQDWYADQLSGGSDPSGPSQGTSRVHRGGAWFAAAIYCRAAYRSRGEPGRGLSQLGFRLARVPSVR